MPRVCTVLHVVENWIVMAIQCDSSATQVSLKNNTKKTHHVKQPFFLSVGNPGSSLFRAPTQRRGEKTA